MLEIGLKGTAEVLVVHENTAAAYGSGKEEVYATPAMIALMEEASCAAIEPHLENGLSSVGTHIEADHLAATPIGKTVYAESELTEIDRRKLTFQVSVYCGEQLIGKGMHQRFIIDPEKFRAKHQS